ncbi:hypothetical protein SARC_04275 [Sphaeroforma arctica JP610]|uniref:Inhibitor of growth protein n=1 Tax=Sphaeroforma arctica JP610 TaxID=667725 RepID=A0A0L0G3Q0_9EUKA|nr:hypothetical protein SARC_04275 [Sphaeroforma arctica JP610]KNC83466.1 hypothetical protein SARC_04275 [Sphaeroforma arctica JP610]|eukprot:XP_014157368.1 hypothetical protein SARC_04275 [Sphaeroforma arctica JP610]
MTASVSAVERYNSVETLPEDLKHNLTHMRELDLKVENMSDSIKRRVDVNFKGKKFAVGSTTPKGMKVQKDREELMEKILADYNEAIQVSESKSNLAVETFNLVTRHKQRLEIEIKKFKLDLERKQPGVTAMGEQRSRLLDTVITPQPNAIAVLGNTIKRQRGVEKSVEPPAKKQVTETNVRTATGSIGRSGLAQTATSQRRINRGASAGAVATPTPTPAIIVQLPKPTEETYCICNQVSYGEMVGCDNENSCLREWFHYSCVGLTEAPKGKWYCPECRVTMKRRGKF